MGKCCVMFVQYEEKIGWFAYNPFNLLLSGKCYFSKENENESLHKLKRDEYKLSVENFIVIIFCIQEYLYSVLRYNFVFSFWSVVCNICRNKCIFDISIIEGIPVWRSLYMFILHPHIVTRSNCRCHSC